LSLLPFSPAHKDMLWQIVWAIRRHVTQHKSSSAVWGGMFEKQNAHWTLILFFYPVMPIDNRIKVFEFGKASVLGLYHTCQNLTPWCLATTWSKSLHLLKQMPSA
jgi:hypothetical protein